MHAATNLGSLRRYSQKAQHKEHMKPPVKKDESEVKKEDVTEDETAEILETHEKRQNCDIE